MMAKSRSDLIADSLERVTKVAKGHVVRSEDMSRTDRERLLQHGYLLAAIKGWYLLVTPEAEEGESTPWFASYWEFLAHYLDTRFGHHYCLGAEASLHLHLGETNVPKQVSVITRKGGQSVIELPHETSLVMYEDERNLPDDEDVITLHGNLRAMSLPMCLARLAASFFERSPDKADIALRMLSSASDLARVLVKGRYTAAANRIVGAYRHIGADDMAQTLQGEVESAGFKLDPVDPFEPVYLSPLTQMRLQSPYGARLRATWESMRKEVLQRFPPPPGLPKDAEAYVHAIEEKYENDAYNSLSIEGYRVTPELIERMRAGTWSPETNPHDRSHAAALAAKGYQRAFKLVTECIQGVLAGEDAGLLLSEYLHRWYRALFSANVDAGLLQEHDLIGYRRQAVYIKGAMHVPPPVAAVSESMITYLGLMQNETEPAARAVLGHFMFVYIHPYADGNGRLARFLMNVMLASGGYPWTIMPIEERDRYMKSLEAASTKQDIVPFTDFVVKQLNLA